MIAVAKVADEQDDQHIQVLHAAAEGLDLLVKGLRRRNGKPCDLCSYEPAVIRYHLNHWRELETAASGLSSAGANPIGSGTRDRLKLLAIKADLEWATDQALEPLIRWQAVARIYRRQSRFRRYCALRTSALLNLHRPEPTAPLAEAICIEAIARVLGWRPHEVCQ